MRTIGQLYHAPLRVFVFFVFNLFAVLSTRVNSERVPTKLLDPG